MPNILSKSILRIKNKYDKFKMYLMDRCIAYDVYLREPESMSSCRYSFNIIVDRSVIKLKGKNDNDAQGSSIRFHYQFYKILIFLILNILLSPYTNNE